MNLFVLFGDEAISRKKMTETLHHALRAMMQFPVKKILGDTPSPSKKINSFLKSSNPDNCIKNRIISKRHCIVAPQKV
jgi:hypothetical protein